MSAPRDWLHVQSQPPSAQIGRVLLKTPHEIAVRVTHHGIEYGKVLEEAHYGHVLRCIKRAIFQAVRDEITEQSRSAA